MVKVVAFHKEKRIVKIFADVSILELKGRWYRTELWLLDLLAGLLVLFTTAGFALVLWS